MKASNSFSEEINVREILMKYLVHWRWFALTLLISFTTVFVMLRYTPVNYESKAELLIKYEKGGAYSELSAFQDLGLFEGIGGYNNLYNEIEILSSRTLIERTVRRLGLNVKYYLIGTTTGIERKEFYQNSPVTIEFVDDQLFDVKNRIELNLEVLDDWNFRINEPEVLSGKTYKFNHTIKTSFGNIKLHTTKFYRETDENLRLSVIVMPIDNTVSQYQSSLKIEPISEEKDILQLTVTGPVIAKNNHFLDTLIEEHTKQTIEDQQKIYKNTTDFINHRITILSTELSDVEIDEEKYKSKYDFSDIFLNEKSLYERTMFNERSMIEAEIQLELSGFLYRFLQDNQGNKDLLPTNLGLEDVSINETAAEFNKIALERDRVLSHSNPQNPTVIKLEKELVSLKNSLLTSLKNLQSSLEMEVKRLHDNERTLSAGISELPKHKRIIRSIDRQQQLKESLYIYLLQKREENEIALAITEGNSRVIEAGFSNGAPVYPRKKIYYALAFFIGFIVPFSTIYLRSLLNNKVYGAEDLEKYDLPQLASIPKVSEDTKVVISKVANSPEAEAFRILRTNISFLLNKKNGTCSTIITTSTLAKEGKSFIALNLSASFALSGKRTVVVGLDLRAPKLMEYADLKESKGVTDFILDATIDINTLLIPSPTTENLYFLPSGVIPPNPAELLLRPETTLMFEKLRSLFDVIVVDTAPVGLVTDTLLISELADAIVYVVRVDYLDKKMLNVPAQLREDGKLKNIGIVLNAIDYSKRSSYTYGYGYGYGYSYDQTQQRKRNWFKRLFQRR